MAYEVQMPKWGLTMKTGKIARWLVSEGGAVETGQPLLEVETDKITNVVESPASGVLLQIVSPQGEVVPVMQVIGVIGAAGEAVAAQPSASAAASSAAPAKTEKAPASGAAAKASGEPVRAMPAARRLAAELGVDLASVQGSGRDGAVTEKDVRAAHEAAQKAPAAGGAAPAASGSCTGSASSGPCCEDEIVPMDGLRKLIADNMMASLQGAAQLTVFVEADVTEMVALRDSMLARNKKNPDYRLSYNDIIAFAVCRALLRHPVMNSTLREDGIHLHKHVNLGMAVSLDTGLIVPNVKNADTFSLEQLKEKVRDAASRARKGGLSMDEISGGTFTISNVSMLGVDGFTPILNPPETGILGVGRVVEKPGVFEGEVCVRKMMTLSLTFNHMVTDGGPAMSFLRTLADMLEKPVRMLG